MNTTATKAASLTLVALATLRATRFVTSDFLGEWTVTGPAKLWAHRHESDRPQLDRVVQAQRNEEPIPTPPASQGWRSKLVKGLDCPFCVGFWLGGVLLLGEATIGRSPLRPLWRFGLSMAGMNYLVGHLSSRID